MCNSLLVCLYLVLFLRYSASNNGVNKNSRLEAVMLTVNKTILKTETKTTVKTQIRPRHHTTNILTTFYVDKTSSSPFANSLLAQLWRKAVHRWYIVRLLFTQTVCAKIHFNSLRHNDTHDRYYPNSGILPYLINFSLPHIQPQVDFGRDLGGKLDITVQRALEIIGSGTNRYISCATSYQPAISTTPSCIVFHLFDVE